MNTLQIIIRELERQRAEKDLGYLVIDPPEAASLDGNVDLIALAKAIDDATTKEYLGVASVTINAGDSYEEDPSRPGYFQPVKSPQ